MKKSLKAIEYVIFTTMIHIIGGGCSGSSDTDTKGDARVPVCDTDENLPSTYEADLSDTTSEVNFWQDKGQGLVQILENSGLV